MFSPRPSTAARSPSTRLGCSASPQPRRLQPHAWRKRLENISMQLKKKWMGWCSYHSASWKSIISNPQTLAKMMWKLEKIWKENHLWVDKDLSNIERLVSLNCLKVRCQKRQFQENLASTIHDFSKRSKILRVSRQAPIWLLQHGYSIQFLAQEGGELSTWFNIGDSWIPSKSLLGEFHTHTSLE